MKLSDYVASFLAGINVRHVFAISGGASLHLIDSIARTPGIRYICPQHEQAGAMAADAYSRVTGHLGVAISTSGPGATNMITGICSAYYDSIPVLFITGQVATFRFSGDTGVRQMGFQETDIVSICRPITKYVVRIDRAHQIRYELEKAYHIALTGRPGPVVVDLPDDLQRSDIDPETLEGFTAPIAEQSERSLAKDAARSLELLKEAKRPVIILGAGVRLAHADREARELIESLNVPVLPTWAVLDIFPGDHPLLAGPFGSHGTRHGNFAVQNCDFLLSIGCRLDTRATGGYPTFAREAKRVVVDIDICELNKYKKFDFRCDLLVQADAGEFIRELLLCPADAEATDFGEWISLIDSWKRRYPACAPEKYEEKDVNPYVFVKELSRQLNSDEVIFSDTGCALAWMTQAFEFKENQRFIHDFNNTAMGWALPAAIGACFALDGKQIICVTGDGSLQMNIQELATVLRHDLPIKIFLLNNHGYSMILQTQDQWLNSRYEGTTVESGLAFPDFVAVAKAYGYRTLNITRNDQLTEGINCALNVPGPVFCNIEIRPDHNVAPQVRFGRPLEDGEPFLERKELFENMIVKPVDASLR
jgi:acetolactate synthase-1/2/3 large subunit